jgi:hypothetical protein
MCDECSHLTVEQAQEILRTEILAEGWCVMAFEGDGVRNPPFAYTIGLSRIDHPEFITFGMHRECADAAIWPLASAVVEGRRFDEGDDLAELYPQQERPQLLRFPDSSFHLIIANELYRTPGGPPVPALQLFWPSQLPLLRGDL